jgi:hypothetical protein
VRHAAFSIGVARLYNERRLAKRSPCLTSGDRGNTFSASRRERLDKGGRVAGSRTGGIGLGGILVILGIVLIIVWSFWWGLIIGLIGLVFFGGFAKGKWY